MVKLLATCVRRILWAVGGKEALAVLRWNLAGGRSALALHLFLLTLVRKAARVEKEVEKYARG